MQARSLRVTLVIVAIIVIFFAVVFLFVLFLVRLFPKKDISSGRATRILCDEALWEYSGHFQMVLCARCQEQRVISLGVERNTTPSAAADIALRIQHQ